MLSVMRLGNEAYAANVRRDLVEQTGRAMAAATVHVTLVRLQEKGYLRSKTGHPEAVRGGRSTRCFKVTPSGLRALRAARQVLDRMWDRVEDHAT